MATIHGNNSITGQIEAPLGDFTPSGEVVAAHTGFLLNCYETGPIMETAKPVHISNTVEKEKEYLNRRSEGLRAILMNQALPRFIRLDRAGNEGCPIPPGDVQLLLRRYLGKYRNYRGVLHYNYGSDSDWLRGYWEHYAHIELWLGGLREETQLARNPYSIGFRYYHDRGRQITAGTLAFCQANLKTLQTI